MMNYRMNLIAIVLLIISCSSMKPDLRDEFIDFVKNDPSIKKAEIKNDQFFNLILPSNCSISPYRIFIYKENRDYKPRIILIWNWDEDDCYSYEYLLDTNQIQIHLKYLSELLIKFADFKNWENDYYL